VTEGATSISRPACKNCNATLPASHTGPCPQCRLTVGKLFRVGITATSRGRASLQMARTFWPRNRPVFVFLLVITLLPPFAGLFISGWAGVAVGLFFAVLSLIVGPYAVTRVNEIIRLP
jgi:hypothetical protein